MKTTHTDLSEIAFVVWSWCLDLPKSTNSSEAAIASKKLWS